MSDEEEVEATPARVFRRGDHVELGRALLEAIGGADPLKTVVFDEGILYRYVAEHGLWAPTTGDDCSRLVQGFAGTPVSSKRMAGVCINATDIKGAVKCAEDQAATRPNFFREAPEGVSFKNGFLEVRGTGTTLKRFSIHNRSRSGYWFPYAENATTPPLFGRFLADVFRGDADADDKIAFLQEHAGVSLLGRAPKFQRCALMVGGGDCGKSTYADIIMGCFPDNSIATVAPQTMHKEYDRATLVGKLLNYVAEMPEGDIVDGGPLKALTDGSPISARQPYGRVFQFKSEAGQLLNANRLPGTNDQTHGFFRRFGIIEFNRSFTDDPSKNVNMAAEIIAAERAAIAAWLIAGAVRLIARGAYNLPASHTAALKQWQMGVDQIRAFLADQTHPLRVKEAAIGATALYDHYARWAIDNGHKALSSSRFGVRLKELKCGSYHTKNGNRYPLALGRGEAGVAEVKVAPSPVTRGKVIDIGIK